MLVDGCGVARGDGAAPLGAGVDPAVPEGTDPPKPKVNAAAKHVRHEFQVSCWSSDSPCAPG